MSDVYHWQDESGAWQLARKTENYRLCFGVWDALVQHLYSNRLEWVPESKLKPYPAEEIPTP